MGPVSLCPHGEGTAERRGRRPDHTGRAGGGRAGRTPHADRAPRPPPSGSDPGEGSASPPLHERGRARQSSREHAEGGPCALPRWRMPRSPGTLRRSQPEGPAQAPALAGTQRHGHTGCCSGPGIRTLAAGAGGAGASALLTRQPETRGSPLTSQTPRFTRKPRTRDTPRSRLHLITAKRTLTGDGLGGPKLQAPLSSLWGQDTSPLPPMLPSQRAQNPAAQRSQRHPPSASPILMCHNVPGTRLRLRVTSRAG